MSASSGRFLATASFLLLPVRSAVILAHSVQRHCEECGRAPHTPRDVIVRISLAAQRFRITVEHLAERFRITAIPNHGNSGYMSRSLVSGSMVARAPRINTAICFASFTGIDPASTIELIFSIVNIIIIIIIITALSDRIASTASVALPSRRMGP
mmetsp:Transcript_7358/g.16232  ORF Transcript_7358/g.16232 Transcript_7358/m.16232 type:complete len:155 (+) Transcript_7358:568-1032(+)